MIAKITLLIEDEIEICFLRIEDDEKHSRSGGTPGGTPEQVGPLMAFGAPPKQASCSERTMKTHRCAHSCSKYVSLLTDGRTDRGRGRGRVSRSARF